MIFETCDGHRYDENGNAITSECIRQVWKKRQPKYKVRFRLDCLVECEVGADCEEAAKDEAIERLIGAALKNDCDIHILDICDAEYEEVK